MAEMAKLWTNKAGHMETMPKKLISEVKTVAKWPEKPKSRVAKISLDRDLNLGPWRQKQAL